MVSVLSLATLLLPLTHTLAIFTYSEHPGNYVLYKIYSKCPTLNYKPLDDFSTPKFKRRKTFKNQNQNKNKSVIFHRKYSIQEVIKSNQVILIQVVKEERGNKGAAVTTRLSLAGKYEMFIIQYY